MMSWTVSDDSVVHISPGGAVVGCRNGNAVISASPYQGAEVVGFNIKVGGQ